MPPRDCHITLLDLRRMAGVAPTKVEAVSDLLKPFDARLMRSYPVSTRINHVANDDEECSRSVELAEVQNRLSL